MKRRKFVYLTFAGSIAAATPFCKTSKPTPTPLNTPKFLATICDIQTIHKIGADYRASTPDENHENHLRDLLSSGLDQNKDLGNQISNKIKDDFTAGRTITLDGWVISITEARQCALNSIQLP